MPLQKPRPQDQSQNRIPSMRQQRPERRRTLHTISELSVTEAATPDFSTFITELKRQPLDQICQPKATADVVKISNRRSLPQHAPHPQCSQVRATRTAPLAYAQSTHHPQIHQAFHDDEMRNDEEGWNSRREKARVQRERAAAAQEYRQHPLHQVVPDGSNPAIPRKAVHSISRSSLRSYSNQHHVLANSHSLSGLSSSSSSGNLDRRSSLGTSRSHPEAWSHEPESAERLTSRIDQHPHPRNIAVRRSKSGSSSDARFLSAVPPPIPVASLPPIPRYYPMPSQYLGNGARSTVTGPMRPGSIPRTSSLPSIRIDHVESWHQGQRKTLSHASQQQHQAEVQRARSESLAALTGAHPASYSHRRASPPNLNELRQALVSPPQHHRASLPHRSYSDIRLMSPPQYNPLRSSKPDQTIPQHNISLAIEHGAVPKRESLAQWKAEMEGAWSIPDGLRRAEMKERVRRANEMEVEREEELMKKGKSGPGGMAVKGRGCFGGVMRRLFGVEG